MKNPKKICTSLSSKFTIMFSLSVHCLFSEMYGDCVSTNGARDCDLSAPNIPPVMSSMLWTKQSIRYGRVTVDARMPEGDWLWPGMSVCLSVCLSVSLSLSLTLSLSLSLSLLPFLSLSLFSLQSTHMHYRKRQAGTD